MFHVLLLYIVIFNLVDLWPCTQVISIIRWSLASFDEDCIIPAFGFGNISTNDKAVFLFSKMSSRGSSKNYNQLKHHGFFSWLSKIPKNTWKELPKICHAGVSCMLRPEHGRLVFTDVISKMLTAISQSGCNVRGHYSPKFFCLFCLMFNCIQIALLLGHIHVKL